MLRSRIGGQEWMHASNTAGNRRAAGVAVWANSGQLSSLLGLDGCRFDGLPRGLPRCSCDVGPPTRSPAENAFEAFSAGSLGWFLTSKLDSEHETEQEEVFVGI
jgi:hypothetical protein